jgi:hypothetical protein
MDAGQWQYTDAGWYWQSDYPWGDIAFHYGRWIDNGYTGGRWAWVPAYDWAPSWVVWSEGDGGVGWAPLPWGVEFRPGLGLFWNGAVVTDGIYFGLGFDAFVFVDPGHFWGGDYHRYAFDRARARDFFGHSRVRAGYSVEGGHLRAEGLGRDHMKEITHHDVVEHKAADMRQTEEHNDFGKRTAEHRDLARPTPTRVAESPNHLGATPGREPESASRPGSVPEREPGTAPRSGSTFGSPARSAAGSGSPNSKPNGNKNQNQ